MALDERVALVENLVQLFNGPRTPANNQHIRERRDRVLKTIKGFQAPRINHFAVFNRLEGLSERAEIYNRGDLATALRGDILQARDLGNKFMPEHLALLLELSDHPIDKTELYDLHGLRRDVVEHPLTWDELLRDEPFDNSDGLWDNVDYAEDSSIDGEEYQSFVSISSGGTHESASVKSIPEINGFQSALESSIEPWCLDHIKVTRNRWAQIEEGTDTSINYLSENEIMRETLAMLRGYGSSLFIVSDAKLIPRTNVSIQQLSHQALYDVLCQLASLGSRLEEIRRRVRQSCKVPVLQTFQYAISAAMSQLCETLSGLDERCIEPISDPFTILDLLSEVRLLCKKLVPLAELLHVEQSDQAGKKALDAIFNFVCVQQSLGSAEGYEVSVAVFNACFATYLRPIKKWVLLGEIDGEAPLFFIRKTEKASTRSPFWSSKFEIVLDRDQRPCVPSFLLKFVGKILNSGKSAQFLEVLGSQPEDTQAVEFKLAPFENTSKEPVLTPFGQVFEHAFSQWIDPIHLRITNLLSKTLSSECGLQDIMNAMQALFLGQNGSALNHIADAFLERVEESISSLRDSSTLTRIYHEAFSSTNLVEEDRIFIRYRSTDSPTPSRLGSLLENIEISYKMPWVMSNIIQPETISVYRRIHATVLHLRLAKRAIDEKFHQKMIRHGSRQSRSSTLGLYLSHRLRWFAHSMEAYFLGIALQDAIADLHHSLSEPGDIDAKIHAHNAFVASAERRFLLETQAARTHGAILSLLDMTVVAGTHLQSQWRLLHDEESITGKPDQIGSSSLNEQCTERLEGYVAMYEKLLGFIHAGILETARVAGDKCLQMLADSFPSR